MNNEQIEELRKKWEQNGGKVVDVDASDSLDDLTTVQEVQPESNSAGEWLDKEPRADGKPRRWKPSEIITVDPKRVISQDDLFSVSEVQPEFKSTLTPEQLSAATVEIGGRSFSGRHPELGKMVNCAVCGLRHRTINKCEQRFTYKVKDKDGRLYSQYREVEKDGEVSLVPDYRTAIPADQKPTQRQISGPPPRPNQFVGPRYNPHYSKIKLQFIQKVRAVYDAWYSLFQTNLVRITDEDLHKKVEETYNSQFKDRLHSARVVAARQIRKERREERKYRHKLGIR